MLLLRFLHPLLPPSVLNMDALQSAFDLCLKIHEMHGTYTSNKQTCAWLTRQVKVIEQTLGQQLARNAVPPDLDGALLSLLEVHTSSPPPPPTSVHPPRKSQTRVTTLLLMPQTATRLPVTHLTGPARVASATYSHSHRP